MRQQEIDQRLAEKNSGITLKDIVGNGKRDPDRITGTELAGALGQQGTRPDSMRAETKQPWVKGAT
jgi:hypothetical protein